MPAIDRFKLYKHQGIQAADFHNGSTPEHYPPDLELEPFHLEIDLHVDVAAKKASGRVTTSVRARADGPAQISLDAVDFEDVDVRDPDGRALTWRYDGQKLAIRWEKPFQEGEERRVTVAYRVVDPVDGLYFSRPDDSYPDLPWYAATDHETERARHWLPCVDLPNVRTTLEIRLRAEERFTILANGLLVAEESHGDGTKTATWKLEQLCPSYLVCFALGDFVEVDDGSFDDGEKQIELKYYCSRLHKDEDLLRGFGRTGPIMAWMTKKLDMAFPFPKYYQFSLPLMGGAMENISLVSWGDWAILNEATAAEAGLFVDLVNVHEMAHSYFGDAVVCRDFAHAWLKESWATYMEQCWSEDERSEDDALFVYYDHAQAYFQEADEEYTRPIVTRRFKSSWQMYDRHLYPGGACRLHTLRKELGDGLFWEAVQDYLRRYDGKVVETDHFRHVMEEHSGRSLGQFFDQWFFRAGYPSIKVDFSYDSDKKMGSFTIEQTQADEEKGVPPFVLSTDLGWTIDGKEHTLPIKLEEARHVLTVPMAAEPEQVRFDPGAKILHKLSFNPGDPMLRRQLREAPDVIGRILAAHELAKTGKQANLQAVVEAYEDESFWGAREEFVKALVNANSETAVAGLLKIIAAEQDPMVLPTVFGRVKKMRDTRVRDALRQRLQGELGPIARGNAFRAMGAQRKEADWDLLVEGSRTPGHNGIAQSGAIRGLADTRRDEAVETLLEMLPYGKQDNQVRPEVALALADIGKGLERSKRELVVEALADHLRDPWYWTHRDAAAGLYRMRATEAIPELEAYGRTQSHQSRVRIEGYVETLRQEDKSDGSAVKKQVEDLRDQVRKLEDQLQKLAAQVEAAERD